MINRYADHSANERTYLAWIRTSIAIMAFGFLIEKFELFVSHLGLALENNKQFQPSPIAELVGLSLFFVGIIIIITSTIRFFRYKSAIESDTPLLYGVRNTNIFLSILLIIMAMFLLLYMGYQLFGSTLNLN